MSTGSRPGIALDGTWGFIADPEGLYDAQSLPNGDSIQVPGCWEAQVARPYRIIHAWYRRAIEIPTDWAGGSLHLRFGAVMYRCNVWLNGRRVGSHEGGYTPFTVVLDPAVRYGETNEIAVEVVNPLNAIEEYPAFSVEQVRVAEEFEPEVPLSGAPHGKQTWYSSMSGLWQSVRLERVPRVHLGPVLVRPDVPGGRALVSWRVDGGGAEAPAARHRIAIEIRDAGGNVVGTDSVEAGADLAGTAALKIESPRLWDFDDPHLYTVSARLTGGRDGEDGSDDLLEVRFGMREISTRNGCVELNGRPIYLVGVLDQDFYAETISTPPSRELLDHQIRLAKEMGINILRCHIKVPDPAYLEAADEAGMLVWCELPNWTTFSSVAAARGRETLAAMVESMGNHPSIVIWTIINEDWGTNLRYEARDRLWLRETFDWLKAVDPTRLVVDNSACPTPSTPNFHVRSDLADFHIYFAIPDNAVRWRNSIEEFARRPAWLWSPNGDAESTGDEPLILSEFGNWGLPRLDRLVAGHGREPWWFRTGMTYYRPAGLRRRFVTYGFDRMWPNVNALAEATQWHQFEAMQYEIGQMRRHGSITGYVITELTDAYWEANGLLDPMRGPKVYHDRLAEFNAPDVVVPDLPRRDLWGGERLRCDTTLSSFGAPSDGGELRWRLLIGAGTAIADPSGRAFGGDDGDVAAEGRVAISSWPRVSASVVARLDVALPDVDETADARLVVEAFDSAGARRARSDQRLAILPRTGTRSAAPLRVSVSDPLRIWGVADRVSALGHEVSGTAAAELVIATEVTPALLRHVEDGNRALVLVRDRAAVPPDVDLARRVVVHLRRYPDPGAPGQRSPWEGDWVTNFNWLVPGVLSGLPVRNPLDFAYEEVLPDHVLLGYDPPRHQGEVMAGMFVGWVHTPGAITWTFRQGRGTITLTTFRVAPESGPLATVLLEQLIQHAAAADRRAVARDEVAVPS